MEKYDFDLIVVGTGSGGSVGTEFAANELSKKVAVFEKGVIGGECPNFACVPTKALLHAAEVYDLAKNAEKLGIRISDLSFDYSKIKAFKDLVVSRTGAAEGEAPYIRDKIALIRKEAKFVSESEVEADGKRYSAKNFLIASGSSVFIPEVEGLDQVNFLTFEQAVDLTSLPTSIFILGGGAVGCEFSQIFNSFGSEVYIADRNPRLLKREDKEVGEYVAKLFQKRGIKVLLNSTLKKVSKKGKNIKVVYQKDGRDNNVEVEQLLIASGKRPSLDLNLDKAGVKYSKQGILVNQYLQTSKPHIYAAGDVVGPYLFTHTGYYQSFLAVNNMFIDQKIKADYSAIPRCVYISPEVATVGLTEDEAQKKDITLKKSMIEIGMLGRANTSDQFEGFVKVIADQSGKLLGGAAVSERAGEIIHELGLAINLGVTADQVALTVHSFPTYSEAIGIACSQIE